MITNHPHLMTRIALGVTLLLPLLSFIPYQTSVKDGYYISTNTFAPLFYEIRGTNISWYSDNETKFYGEGTFILNENDSIIDINFSKQKTSRKLKQSLPFNIQLKVKWDDGEKAFKLTDYEYGENPNWVDETKKRIVSSCKITVKKD